MKYSTELPTKFKSWFSFYAEVKPHLKKGQLEVSYFLHDLTSIRPSGGVRAMELHIYSVQYIKDQALEELLELREIQTFNMDELRGLKYGLETAASCRPTIVDKPFRELLQKVDELVYRERQKKRDL